MTFVKKYYKIAIIIFFMLAIILFIGINCPIKAFIGIPCAGCGMTRAWRSFLNMKIQDAFYFHPLFLFAPLLLFLIVDEIKPILKNRTLHYVLFVIVIILFLGVYLLRMLFISPNPPMDFNSNAVIPKILEVFL